jgi:hypothetical protein
MRKFRKIKISLIVLFVAAIGIYLFIQYDKRHLLLNGVLHIKEKPATLKIIRCESYGLSDFRAEYYVSINKNEFTRLLRGRKYTLIANPKDYFTSRATGQECYKFQADLCYTAGDRSNGLVNIFVNKDKTEVYTVYDVI